MVLTSHDYTVGWISALPVEMAPAKAMMDMLHPPLPQVTKDTNNYTLGRIGTHNVVLVCLPETGTSKAAHAAANLLRSFPNVRFGLMVGVGGGVPGPSNPDSTKDIRLGDIVVGHPQDLHGKLSAAAIYAVTYLTMGRWCDSIRFRYSYTEREQSWIRA